MVRTPASEFASLGHLIGHRIIKLLDINSPVISKLLDDTASSSSDCNILARKSFTIYVEQTYISFNFIVISILLSIPSNSVSFPFKVLINHLKFI